MFYHLEETTSTIDEARDARYVHGDVIQAERQTAGRGKGRRMGRLLVGWSRRSPLAR